MTAGRFLLLVASTLVCSITFGQTTQKVRISGSFKNLPDGRQFYITRATKESTEDTLQVGYSKFGKIELNVNSIAIGEFVFIRAKLDSGDKRRNWMLLIVDKPEIEISGDFSEWPLKITTTSAATVIYRNFYGQTKVWIDSLALLKASSNADTAMVRKISQKIGEFPKEYISKHLSSLAAPLLIFERRGIDVNEKVEMYERLSPAAKNSELGHRLKRQISILKLKASYGVGVKMPDYEVELPDGKKESLRLMVSRARYTLIDFWAYWCIPCRREMPGLKRVYSEYSSQGFNIISISIDPNRAQWEKALSEIAARWDQAIDIANTSRELFSLDAIPGYILLNQKAEIIAMDIVGLKFAERSLLGAKGSYDFELTGDNLHNMLGKLLRQD